MAPDAICPTCGAKVAVIQGDEGTAHYEPTEGHLAREWEQRWEGENKRAENYRIQTELRDAEVEKLRSVLRHALPVLEYVSMGRGYYDRRSYPDATARKVNAEIKEALGGP